jgi:hypothetical protein
MGNFHSRADFNAGFCTEVYVRAQRKAGGINAVMLDFAHVMIDDAG